MKFYSFTANYLGGGIHLVDQCLAKETRKNQYLSKSSHDFVPTFRPQLGNHLMATKISKASKANNLQQNTSSSFKPRGQIRKKTDKKNRQFGQNL